MSVLFSNNASTTLSAGVGNSATSITVADGSVFPSISGSDYFYLTLEVNSDPTLKEIVKCTARSGNTLTITRGQDGTSARTFSNGDKCELRLTAAGLNDVATQADTDTTYTAGSGLSLTGTEFANTAPDQTVALTGAGATSISGTYPNFTITSTDTNTDTDTTYTAGTGITLTGTEFSIGQSVATTDSPTFAGLTTTADVSFGDSDKAIFGADSDLQIYHDGSNSFVRDAGTGNLRLQGTNLFLQNAGGTKNYLGAINSGAVTLYHDNAAKLATTSTGIEVTGQVITDASQDAWAFKGTTGSSGNHSGLWFSGEQARLLLRDGTGTIKTMLAANGTDAQNVINGNTIWHAGNDGSGSGLDADTVDGIEASSFLRSDTNDSISAGTTYTFGTSDTEGFRFTNSSYNKSLYIGGWSSSNSAGISRIRNSNDNLHLDSGANGNLYLNHYSSGTIYANGGTVWHSNNDGSGSGLDADKLDGLHASSFLRSDASDSFTGTLTGGALHAGGEITSSSAKLQVNGFQRTGTIYLHEGTSAVAGNNWPLETTSGGELRWNTNKLWHAGNDGSGSGLDADTVDGVEASGFGRFYNNAVLNSSTTTANLISELQNDYGAFNNNYVTLKCSWSYANNSDLVTGHSTIGTIELAGCLVEAWGGTYKHIRITRPTTGTGGSTICVYNDQGSSYSPAWREIWTSESDGAGSGLDADTVDGIDSSRIIFGQNSTGTTRTNPSQTLKSGFYDEYQTNTPTSTWYSYINIRHDNTGNNYGHQIAGSFYDLNLWNRNINNNSFGSWTKSWSSANDGSGSGLDADLLDGVQGGSYLRSDATDYVNGVLYLRADIRNEDAYRDHSCMGHYNSYKTNQIWSMGSSYRSHASGTNFGNLYGAAYKHTNNSTGGTMASGHQFVWCQNGTGYAALGTNIWTSGNVTAYSDIRVKKNIERIPNALDKVCRLNGYTFERTDVKFDNEGEPTVPVKQTGVIAQEVLEVLPEAVTGDEENHYSVAYGNMVGLLIESIKELKAEVDDLKAQLEQNQ